MLILQENSKRAVPNAFCGVGALTKKKAGLHHRCKKRHFFILPTCSLSENQYAQYLIKTPLKDKQELLGVKKSVSTEIETGNGTQAHAVTEYHAY